MDGARRLAQPRKRPSRPASAKAAAGRARLNFRIEIPARVKRLARRLVAPIRNRRFPAGAGVAASALIVLASIGYGVVKGDHVPLIIAHMKDGRDAVAHAAGFRIGEVSIVGRRQLSEKDILAVAGVTERTSLLFLDVDDARGRLQASPWIAEASVRKLYPGRLQIEISEREAFALWQKDGK